MKMNLTEQESIFCQALAMTSLLVELSNKDFLNSDYYSENITFAGNNDILQEILKASGVGNPAVIYLLLTIIDIFEMLFHMPSVNDVGSILEVLKKQIMKYLNTQWCNRNHLEN